MEPNHVAQGMRSEGTSLLNESVTIAGSITDLVHMQDYSTNKYKVVSGTPVQKVPPKFWSRRISILFVYMPCARGSVVCCGTVTGRHNAVQMASTTWSPCAPLWANQNECSILTIDVANASMPLEHSNKGVTRLPWAQIEVEKDGSGCVTVCVTIWIIVIIRLERSVLLAHGPWSGFDTCVL